MQASKEKEEEEEQNIAREAMQKEQDIFQSSRNSLQKRISMLKNQIEQLRENIQGAQEEMQAQEEIIAALKEELQAKEELLQEEYLDKSEILSLRRTLAEHKGRKGSLRQRIAESREKIQEKKLSIESQRSEYREEATTQLSKVNDRLFELRQQLVPSLDKSERLKVRAPISGEVVNMQVHSEDGGVIQPGKPILDIVPKNAELVVECRIRQDQITKVQTGQQARVQLAAFNRVTTPQVKGQVTWVSADRIEERTPRGTQSYYKAHVQVDQESLQEADAYLSAGMPATAFITTEERTFLTYILEPILLNMDRAVRERM
jgi:HlyD family type I secretion membrane fusion protein